MDRTRPGPGRADDRGTRSGEPPGGRGAERLTRLLGEARRAAAGEEAAPAAVIEAPDRDLLRALRRATAEERAGLLRLLARVGARGKRVAERALAAGDLSDDAAADVLKLLAERQPGHALPDAYHGLAGALAAGDVETARRRFTSLPSALRALWVRREGIAALDPPLPALEAMLASDAETAGFVADALERDTPPGVLHALAELAAGSGSRALHKAVRSAFFRLAQQGVAVPELRPLDGPALGEVERVSRAFVSAVDPAGDQAVWVIEELPEGGFALLQAILEADESIGGARPLVLVRRGYESLLKELEAERGVPIVEVPVTAALWILEEAYALNPASAGREYAAWRASRGVDRRARRPELPAPGADERAELVAGSAGLLDSDAFRFWLLSRADAERAERVIGEQGESRLVLPEAEQARRRDEALAQAVAELFPADRRARTARRLERGALLLRARGAEREARRAVAAAEALATGSRWPLLEELVRRSLDALAEARKRDRAERTLVEP